MRLIIVKAPMLAIDIKMLGNLGLKMIFVVHFGINQEASIDTDRISWAVATSLLHLWEHFNMLIHSIIFARVVAFHVGQIWWHWVRRFIALPFIEKVSSCCLSSRVTFRQLVLNVL